MTHTHTSKRTAWVDYAKGIAILSVVLKHVLDGLISAGLVQTGALVQLTEVWGYYRWDLAIFFLVSGLFISRSLERPIKAFMAKRLQTLVYPYFLWSILMLVLGVLLGGSTNHDFGAFLPSLLALLHTPVLHLWFLYALFFMVMSFAICYKLNVSPHIYLFGAIVLYVSWYMLDVRFIGQDMLLFFAFSVVLHQQVKHWLEATPLRQRALFAAMYIGAWLYLATSAPLPTNADPTLTQGTVQLIVRSLGVMGVLLLSSVLAELDRLRILSFFGERSLEIYLAHVPAGAAVRITLLQIGNDSVALHMIVGTILSIALPLLLYVVSVQWLKLPYLFTWPTHKPDDRSQRGWLFTRLRPRRQLT